MRDKRIKVRLSEDELAALNQKVNRTGLSREAYCRAVLNGDTVRQIPPADVAYLLRTMRQNGYCLNQIADRLNGVDEADIVNLRETAAELREAVRLVIRIYS